MPQSKCIITPRVWDNVPSSYLPASLLQASRVLHPYVYNAGMNNFECSHTSFLCSQILHFVLQIAGKTLHQGLQLTLLQWSGFECTVSPRFVCINLCKPYEVYAILICITNSKISKTLYQHIAVFVCP